MQPKKSVQFNECETSLKFTLAMRYLHNKKKKIDQAFDPLLLFVYFVLLCYYYYYYKKRRTVSPLDVNSSFVSQLRLFVGSNNSNNSRRRYCNNQTQNTAIIVNLMMNCKLTDAPYWFRSKIHKHHIQLFSN